MRKHAIIATVALLPLALGFFTACGDEDSGEVKKLTGHTQYVKALAFSPDGSRLVSGSSDWEGGEVMLWNTSDWKSAWTRKITDPEPEVDGDAEAEQEESAPAPKPGFAPIGDLAFSPDGATIAAAAAATQADFVGFGELALLKTSDGTDVYTDEAVLSTLMQADSGGELLSVAFSPDGKRLVAGGVSNLIKMWDLSGAAPTSPFKFGDAENSALKDLADMTGFKGHANDVYRLAYSSDGKLVLSASGDNTVKVWRASDGKLLRTLKGHKDTVTGVAISLDGHYGASSSLDGTVRVWDLSGVSVEDFPEGSETCACNVTNTCCDGCAAVGNGNSCDDGNACTENDACSSGLCAGTKISGCGDTCTGDTACCAQGQPVDDGNGCNDDNPCTYNDACGQGQCLGTALPDFAVCTSESGWGQCLGGQCEEGGALRVLTGHEWGVLCVNFSKDGKYLVTGGDDSTVKVWNVAEGKIIENFKGHFGKVYSVAFAPDQQTVASGGEDLSVRIWDTAGL